jgi:hypothetical protein
MSLRMDNLNSGEQIAAGSALALLVCMFFGWFNFGFETLNAWESLHFVSPALTVVIAVTLAIAGMKAAGLSLGDVPTGSVLFASGCVALLLILFRLVDPVSLHGAEGFENSGSVEAGIFLALLAAGGIAGGGYLATGGTALNQLRKLIPTAAPPPSPPPGPAAAPPATPPPAMRASAAPPPLGADPAGGFCEHCGTALAPGDRFCSGCGAERQAPTPG